MSYRLIAAAAVLLLQGCAQKQPPAVVADDLTQGVSSKCSYTPVQPQANTTVAATITMTNDGWCAYRATETQGKPFLLGLVKQRPAHGELLIRKWAGESRVEYNPNPGFVGDDKFLVALRPQAAGAADNLVQITANVTPGANAPIAAAPAAAAAAEKSRPAATNRSRTSSRGGARAKKR